MRTQIVRRFAAKKGYSIGKIADEQETLDCISLFKPRGTGHELIRIGGTGDGGYLIPNDLNGIDSCFSPGVFNIADFEEMLASQYQIRSFLADFSVDNPPSSNSMFDFEKKYIGSNIAPNYMGLDEWVKRKVGDGSDKDLILQMDIDGGEFDVLIHASVETLRRFRIMAIEFHDMEMLFDKNALPLISSIMRKIRSVFSVAHIHANNCCGAIRIGDIEVPKMFEVTFLRSDRVMPGSKNPISLPHPLDRRNVPKNPDLLLQKIWY